VEGVLACMGRCTSVVRVEVRTSVVPTSTLLVARLARCTEVAVDTVTPAPGNTLPAAVGTHLAVVAVAGMMPLTSYLDLMGRMPF
jgi:hypothetical protein